jgi:hypothetical protein
MPPTAARRKFPVNGEDGGVIRNIFILQDMHTPIFNIVTRDLRDRSRATHLRTSASIFSALVATFGYWSARTDTKAKCLPALQAVKPLPKNAACATAWHWQAGKSHCVHQPYDVSRNSLADDSLYTSYLVFFPSALDNFALFWNWHSTEGVVYLVSIWAVMVLINELLTARHGDLRR